MRTRLLASASLTIAALLLVTGCANDPQISLPPADGTPDYQLGAAYPPLDGVEIVVRDRTAAPPPGVYAICYINGFQTQPGAEWDDDLLLKNSAGEPVTDPNWPDETLLDTSTEASRRAIADRIAPWIRGCADAGYDAVEFDNLDSFLRSDDALELSDNLTLARALVDVAHDAGLAAGQKNASEYSQELKETGFDFAVTEECAVFDECEAYRAVYGPHVIEIEYTDTDLDFAQACADGILLPSAVLRDRNLVGPDDPDYAFETCPAT